MFTGESLKPPLIPGAAESPDSSTPGSSLGSSCIEAARMEPLSKGSVLSIVIYIYIKYIDAYIYIYSTYIYTHISVYIYIYIKYVHISH